MTALFKISMMIFGVLLMALGVVVSPLPGPMGLPIVLLGLIIVLRNSTWAKRQFVKLVKKHPKLLRPLRALMRPGAKIISLIWLSMLRVERAILSRKTRFLHRVRRMLRAVIGHRRSAFA